MYNIIHRLKLQKQTLLIAYWEILRLKHVLMIEGLRILNNNLAMQKRFLDNGRLNLIKTKKNENLNVGILRKLTRMK